MNLGSRNSSTSSAGRLYYYEEWTASEDGPVLIRFLLSYQIDELAGRKHAHELFGSTAINVIQHSVELQDLLAPISSETQLMALQEVAISVVAGLVTDEEVFVVAGSPDPLQPELCMLSEEPFATPPPASLTAPF